MSPQLWARRPGQETSQRDAGKQKSRAGRPAGIVITEARSAASVTAEGCRWKNKMLLHLSRAGAGAGAGAAAGVAKPG